MDPVLYERNGPVAIITFNQPPHPNKDHNHTASPHIINDHEDDNHKPPEHTTKTARR